MNKQELKQIFYYRKEIDMWQEELDKLRGTGLQSPKLDGMPRSQKISDSTGSRAVTIADIEYIIEDLQYRILIKTKEIYEYIRRLDDSMLRQIIKYRCVELCTWQEVADRIGGGNTENSVKMMYHRHFEKDQEVTHVT